MAHTTNELASKTNILEVNQVCVCAWINANSVCKSIFNGNNNNVSRNSCHFTLNLPWNISINTEIRSMYYVGLFSNFGWLF